MIFRRITRKTYFLSGRFFSSILKDRYGFVAPSILNPQSRDPSPSEVNGNKKRRKKKEPYRPPSSLDMTGKKIIHSNLPFDFRFSYTESDPNTKPIGLREPKYSPFGPGRIDRPWTGVSAPAVDPALKSVEGDISNDAEKKMDEWRKRRNAILGEILTPAERAFLIEQCQKHRTKRQVNLGNLFLFKFRGVYNADDHFSLETLYRPLPDRMLLFVLSFVIFFSHFQLVGYERATC